MKFSLYISWPDVPLNQILSPLYHLLNQQFTPISSPSFFSHSSNRKDSWEDHLDIPFLQFSSQLPDIFQDRWNGAWCGVIAADDDHHQRNVSGWSQNLIYSCGDGLHLCFWKQQIVMLSFCPLQNVLSTLLSTESPVRIVFFFDHWWMLSWICLRSIWFDLSSSSQFFPLLFFLQ